MKSPSTYRPIELLAPAGSQECIAAAIENGADAVYFGIDAGFNARARAENFPIERLKNVMDGIHRRNVRGYVTLNTLVFSDELRAFETLVRKVARAGVDAVLVQDLGAARLIREICPDLPIHASTQMSLTSAETIRMVESLDIERVVLARELSIQEIRQITQQCAMPVEVFAHGALCVAYSGQCMTSESLGGRSANRGQCAQACRLPYDLICDNREIDLGDQKYLLSPQDLAAFDLIPELIDAGVCSLKIEGRLKTAEYVANLTQRYRQAIDAAVNKMPLNFSRQIVDEMEMSFSRGFSHGWLDGCDHKALVPAISSAKHGLLVGRISAIRHSSVVVQLTRQRQLKKGDGIVFADPTNRGNEQGGRVFDVQVKRRRHGQPDLIEITFLRRAIDLRQLVIGQEVRKTDDPVLSKRLRGTFSSKHPQRRIPIDVRIVAQTGSPLVCYATLPDDRQITVASDHVLSKADKRIAEEDSLRNQLDRLGTTQFELGQVEISIEGAPMVPLSVFNKLRRKLVKLLDHELCRTPIRRLAHDSVTDHLRKQIVGSAIGTDRSHGVERRLHVLCRTMEQLKVVVDQGIDTILADFQDIREYRQAVEIAKSNQVDLLIATPRIQKPGEIGIFRKMASYEPPAVLARNLAAIDFFRNSGFPVVADASLNVANEITASLLMEMGVKRVTASYDLNRDQLIELVSAAPAGWIEVVIHQHMPMFHMEHCVFCAVLSPGTNKTNCGRPCDVHEVKLRDRVGAEHTLLADVGCRNTLFNQTPQSGAEVVPSLIQSGVADFRIELLGHRSEKEIGKIVRLYRDLLAGNRTGRQVWTELQATNRVGVTRGTLEEQRDPLAII